MREICVKSMGTRFRQEDWETAFRKSVARLSKGWTVRENRGTIVLCIRSLKLNKSIGFKWKEEFSDDALRRITSIYKLVQSGESFAEAIKIAKGKAPKLTHQYNWEETIAAYREHKGSSVKDETWKKKYIPVFTNALKVLKSRNPPTNGPDLSDVALKQWKKGTRQRQIMSQSLNGLLKFAVWRKNFPHAWLPSSEPECVTTEKRVGYPLTENQILRLFDSLPEGEVHSRWLFALMLLAVYGLRPEDLRYLVTRNGGRELWSMYRKSKGGKSGRKTRPRRLYPLLVYDINGPTILAPIQIMWPGGVRASRLNPHRALWHTSAC